ncbi:MAG TPA: tripartite tricarboxylate transporter substrate-binding protein, partial [Quisquiliibacterium sp.]|nr:tripartite tricarboxylate transporter substrate-binding protein [Quisquiliibacterium sp.]
AESGFAGFDVTPWFGLFAPAGTPPAVVARINRDVNEALRAADVVEKFTGQGAEPYLTTPEQFADVLKRDIGTWSKIVKASGAKVD